ncbi:MAG: putative quinol monooxygenase [Pseudomonadota bacterium]
MITVTGLIEVDPSDAAAFAEAARAVSAGARGEAGCHAYAFYEDVEQPGRFRMYEQYADEAALTAHMSEPHFKTFAKALGGLKVTSMDVKRYEAGPATKLM